MFEEKRDIRILALIPNISTLLYQYFPVVEMNPENNHIIHCSIKRQINSFPYNLHDSVSFL